jgi:hypothetical protein
MGRATKLNGYVIYVCLNKQLVGFKNRCGFATNSDKRCFHHFKYLRGQHNILPASYEFSWPILHSTARIEPQLQPNFLIKKKACEITIPCVYVCARACVCMCTTCVYLGLNQMTIFSIPGKKIMPEVTRTRESGPTLSLLISGS